MNMKISNEIRKNMHIMFPFANAFKKYEELDTGLARRRGRETRESEMHARHAN
jgi:hypothetical protein